MKRSNRYVLEYLLVAFVFGVSVAGFWEIYFGADADPNPYQHLHVVTNFAWLGLLFLQLRAVAKGRFQDHRKLGLAVFVIGPLLVATTALLSVHSAHKGLVSGEGDFLIVQNVMGTLELGFLMVAAFVVRKHRALHGAFLLSTAVMFMGVALFFVLISFVPAFRIEGPETFYRFQTAAMTGQAVCLAVGLIFFIKDYRNGWPLLLAAALFPLNELIRGLLAKQDLLKPLTEAIGSMSEGFTFAGAFVIVFGLIAATGVGAGALSRRGDPASRRVVPEID